MTGDKVIPKECEACGKTFMARKYQIKIGRARWCSSKCYNSSRNLANRKPVDFWSMVDKGVGADSCWLWLGATNAGGYGLVFRDCRCQLSHRYAFFISGGLLKNGEVVRHTCDNPPCCNPKHLIAGTQRDNVHDSIKRGRRGYERFCERWLSSFKTKKA